jgi:polysaccharide pyruvyl transferase WcaK-like protein
VSQGYAIRFAWTTESDRLETNAFLEASSLDIEYSLFDSSHTLTNVMDDLSRSDVVIAGRMHALILAKICGCEAVPWLISKKIEVFSTEYLSVDAEYLHQQIDFVIDALTLRSLKG